MIALTLFINSALPLAAMMSGSLLLSLDETEFEPAPPAARVTGCICRRAGRESSLPGPSPRDFEQAPCVRRGRYVDVGAWAHLSLVDNLLKP